MAKLSGTPCVTHDIRQEAQPLSFLQVGTVNARRLENRQLFAQFDTTTYNYLVMW